MKPLDSLEWLDGAQVAHDINRTRRQGDYAPRQHPQPSAKAGLFLIIGSWIIVITLAVMLWPS